MEVDSDSESSVELISCTNVDDQTRSPSTSDDTSNDTSDEDDSSLEVHNRPPDAPFLEAIESPNVAAVVIAFNALAPLHEVFTHSEISSAESTPEYDPEWFRRAPLDRAISSEEEFQQLVKVELRELSAYSSGNSSSSPVSTGNLESLFRLKVRREDEPELEISTLFKLFVEIPEIKAVLLQMAKVESEQVPVLPIPVATDDYRGNLQGALDTVFWSQALLDIDDSMDSINQIPILEGLCDVLAIHCQQLGIIVDEEIWPERYTAKYRPELLKFAKEARDQKAQIERLSVTLETKTILDGESIVEALQIARESLAESQQTEAADEIGKSLTALISETSALKSELQSLEVTARDVQDVGHALPIDKENMTPYRLGSLIWTEFSADSPVTVIRAPSNPDIWYYMNGTEFFNLTWADVTRFAQRTEGYIAFYERTKPGKRASNEVQV